jgi:uncharacterized protein
MIKIKLREIEDGQHQMALDLPRPPGLPAFSDVKGNLTVNKNNGTLWISGKLSYRVELDCSRCLKSFAYKDGTDINLFYRPQNSNDKHPGGRETELKADELDVVTYKGQEIDLWPEISEALELSLPVKPLCKKSCKGICSGCGKDLGLGKCSCPSKEIDPRWEKLLKLKKGK